MSEEFSKKSKPHAKKAKKSLSKKADKFKARAENRKKTKKDNTTKLAKLKKDNKTKTTKFKNDSKAKRKPKKEIAIDKVKLQKQETNEILHSNEPEIIQVNNTASNATKYIASLSFNDFELSSQLKKSLEKMKYVNPTQIQEEAIPLIIEGKDILASSQTGTGKTGAFLIPIIDNLSKNDDSYSLIITPTRELAKQVQTFADQMTSHCKNIKTVLLIGGDDMSKQLNKLKRNPKIVVGTPGRINDHLKRKSLKLSKTKLLVLDETDRMLDMGFGVQINDILSFMPVERQTILFSATLPKDIITMSENFLKDPVRITIGGKNAIAENITQNIINTEDKLNVLKKELNKIAGTTLIFMRTKRSVEKMNERLKELELSANILHGDLRQRDREKTMRQFRNKKFDILIATDVAARGLDVPHIEHVINYDIPDCPEDYIHRIGRTARAEKSGIATSLISKKDKHKWNAVQYFINGEEEKIITQKKPSRKTRKSTNKGKRKKDYKKRK